MYEIGDIVRLVNGRRRQRVMEINAYGKICCCYVGSEKYFNQSRRRQFRAEAHYVLCNLNQNKEKETMTLYETKDGRFGIKLATNSKGLIVLEMKGTGEAEAFEKDTLTEVTPYTVEIKFTSGVESGKNYHYISNEGDVKVNDLLVISGKICVVQAVDTKEKSATKELKGSKLSSTVIGE